MGWTRLRNDLQSLFNPSHHEWVNDNPNFDKSVLRIFVLNSLSCNNLNIYSLKAKHTRDSELVLSVGGKTTTANIPIGLY